MADEERFRMVIIGDRYVYTWLQIFVREFYALRKDILGGRTFGELTHPQNLTQFGGIYFGDSGKILYLAVINFGQ